MADDSDQPPAEDAPQTIALDPVPVDTEARRQIEAHIARFWGEPAAVTEELAPVEGGIDLHIVPPSLLHPFYTLVTVGMSDLAMHAPPGAETLRYAELLLALPPRWPMDSQVWRREERYWPIRWLRALARMPYLHETWVRPGYALPHGGDPPRPYARNTRLCALFVAPPMCYEQEALSVFVRPDKTVRFHAVVPIYRDELVFCYEAGPRALRMRLTERHVTELLDIHRKSAVARRWFGRG